MVTGAQGHGGGLVCDDAHMHVVEQEHDVVQLHAVEMGSAAEQVHVGEQVVNVVPGARGDNNGLVYADERMHVVEQEHDVVQLHVVELASAAEQVHVGGQVHAGELGSVDEQMPVGEQVQVVAQAHFGQQVHVEEEMQAEEQVWGVHVEEQVQVEGHMHGDVQMPGADGHERDEACGTAPAACPPCGVAPCRSAGPPKVWVDRLIPPQGVDAQSSAINGLGLALGSVPSRTCVDTHVHGAGIDLPDLCRYSGAWSWH